MLVLPGGTEYRCHNGEGHSGNHVHHGGKSEKQQSYTVVWSDPEKREAE